MEPHPHPLNLSLLTVNYGQILKCLCYANMDRGWEVNWLTCLSSLLIFLLVLPLPQHCSSPGLLVIGQIKQL